MLARATRPVNIEKRNVKSRRFLLKNITQALPGFLSELFFNNKSSFVTNHKSSVKNLNLVLGCQVVKLQYTENKYLSTYRLCFWNRHDVFQRNSIQLPQHYLCLRLEDSRNKLLIYLQDRVVMFCFKSRPLSFYSVSVIIILLE